MKIEFRRVTSSGEFIPEIDGLKFIAISSVVLFHLRAFFLLKDKNLYEATPFDFHILDEIISRFHLGVPLFFVLSGFILGKPFVERALKGGDPIKLKVYFLRRLTRIEPPYFLVITVIFIGYVFFLKKYSFSEGLDSYLASVIYCHNFIYGIGTLPLLLNPAWSLEVEIQFYIIAPLFTFLFIFKNSFKRRLFVTFLIISFIFFDFLIQLPFYSILNFAEYFLLGFLLADIYSSNNLLLPITKYDKYFSLVSFILIFMFDSERSSGINEKIIREFIKNFSIFLFCYYVIIHKTTPLLSNKFITAIGGMCYSIYLIHLPAFSLFGNKLMDYKFYDIEIFNITLYAIIILIPTIALSVLFFLLIERPCMNKDWLKNLVSRLNKIGS